MPAMQEAQMRRGLPCWRGDSGFHPALRKGHARGRAGSEEEEQPARHLRPGLPPGDAVRERLRPGQEGRTGGHRPAGALCGRLGTARRSAQPCEIAPPTGKKVAVVGSGPGRPDLAADLARAGHEVTIFEALHEAGGVLVYGIPEFRLPKSIVEAEVDYVQSLGADLKLDAVVGRQVQHGRAPQQGYDAVFLGIGAGAPRFHAMCPART